MVWLAENIQACLRIFRRTQHQWLARDILHPSQGVFIVFVLWPHRSTLMRTYPLAYCPPGSICGMLSIPRALPPVTHGSALQAPECLRLIFLPRIRGRWSCGKKKRSKSLLLSLGLHPYSLMRMLSHESELPCLTIHIRLVCP